MKIRAICFLCMSSFSSAQTAVPYATLYRALEPGLVIARFEHLRAVQRIQSRLPEVAPGQIQVSIRAKSGTLNIAIDSRGHVQFPMSEALLAENPMVQSNQPKGSLSVSATMECALVAGSKLAYSALMDCSQQAQSALAALGPSMSGRNISSIEFEFDPAQNANVQLNDDKAEEVLVADASGMVRVRIDPRKIQRHAVLMLSAPALAVRPQIE
jgi:hypothetical protein